MGFKNIYIYLIFLYYYCYWSIWPLVAGGRSLLGQEVTPKFMYICCTHMHCTELTHKFNIHPLCCTVYKEGRKMFYLTMHSTYFIYGYMASDIWIRTILIVRKETCCRHIGYSYRLTARVLLYAPSHRQNSTYHSLCYTSHGALGGMRNSSVGSPHEGSIRRPIAP